MLEITYREGLETPVLRFNGTPYNFLAAHFLSRYLTNTTDEQGLGIFNGNRQLVDFYRGSAKVTVKFPQTWNEFMELGPNPHEIMTELRTRINQVEDAFSGIKGLVVKPQVDEENNNELRWQPCYNGEEYEFDFQLSRVLTNTTSESSSGIFTDFTTPVVFYRQDKGKLTAALATFTRPFSDFENAEAEEVYEEIQNRILAVEDAFANPPATINITVEPDGPQWKLSVNGNSYLCTYASVFLTGSTDLFNEKSYGDKGFPVPLSAILRSPDAATVHRLIRERAMLINEQAPTKKTACTLPYSSVI